MNEHLRDRILRKLDTLPDERGYQVLDYAEFLESRYAERQTPTANPFTRFAEAVEDKMRAGKVSANTIAEAMGLMNKAANVLNGALAAGRSMANDFVTTTSTRPSSTGGTPASPGTAQPSSSTASPAAPASASSPSPSSTATPSSESAMRPGNSTTPEASSPAHDTRIPGSPGEKL